MQKAAKQNGNPQGGNPLYFSSPYLFIQCIRKKSILKKLYRL